jgi:site-specific recombinase XerC
MRYGLTLGIGVGTSADEDVSPVAGVRHYICGAEYFGNTSLFKNDARVATFQQAAEDWLRTHTKLTEIRPSTEAEYRRALRLHAFPPIGGKPVSAVTREDIRGLVVKLLEHGKSRSLARNLLAPIRQMFDQLIDDGVLTANPAARMGRYLKGSSPKSAG